jgi:hypothetical protein
MIALRDPEEDKGIEEGVGKMVNGGALIGKKEDCALVISGTSMSRQHAKVTQNSIEDCGSANGTFISFRTPEEAMYGIQSSAVRVSQNTMVFINGYNFLLM